MTLTKQEKSRLADIRSNLRKFKRDGFDVRHWDQAFFLRIVDRLMRKRVV